MWYREGTITFTQGSDALTGTGTYWNVTANGVLPGMIVIGPDNKLYEIKHVISDTSLFLAEPYTGETQTDVPCRIITTYEGDLTQFSARFTALMTRMSADSKTMRSWLMAVDEVTLEREDGTEVTVKSLTQIVDEHNANQKWYTDNSDAINAAGDKAREAAASALAAAESANTASTKATEASQSAAAAAASENAADASASAAKTSETNAESFKVDAAESAATASAKATEAGESATSAVASKEAAKESETQAATSASEASASASSASNSAAAAKTSETNASASEHAVAGSVAEALASKNAAKESETHAVESAAAAAGSADAASKSATAAADSATTATEKANVASEQATDSKASASAAKTSETNAKSSETAAEGFATAAENSAGEASASATTATEAMALAEAKAKEASDSAALASTKATEATDASAGAKTSELNAKESESKAYEYAQNAQASVSSVKWKGTSAEMDMAIDAPKWVKVSTARMPQSTSTVYFEVIGGAGYEAGQPGLAAMADIVLRTAAGDPKSVNAVAYRTMDSAVLSVATVNTADDNYDIYLKAGAGSQKLIVNLQSAGAVVETLEVLEVIDSLPDDAVEGTVYHRVISDQDGSITAPNIQLRGQGSDTRQYIMGYGADGATSWYMGKANNGSDNAMFWSYTGSNGIELDADGNVYIDAKGKRFTLANNGNLGLVASLDQSSVPQGTYHQVALNTGTAGGKTYLRKFCGGDTDTIWHETVQSGLLRLATGNEDEQEELSISTDYGVRARGEITSLSANGLRVAYGNYGFLIRNDGSTTYFLLTASGDKFGNYNTFRPMYINNASGAVTMGNGLTLDGGLNVTSGNIRIPTSSTSWVDMRNNAALSNSSAVGTSSASAIIRQEHADRHYFVGGLGNSQFGFYMINKSRTANGTDANAYLQNDGTWVCGGNGSFNDVYIRSDRRSKRNIRKIERALDKLEQIEGVLYEIQVYDRYEHSGGLIAQDVQKVQPELVTVDHNDQSGEERLRLNYNGVIGMLVEAVKELREEVRELKARM